MQRAFVLFLLLLVFPIAAFADSSVDFGNSSGTLTGSNSGLSLTGSTLDLVNGLDGLGKVTGNLGTVEFSTGALTSGSFQFGGTFAAGGSFTITGNGTNGIPNGVIFAGTFSAPATWTLVTLPDGTHSYTLTATLSGSLLGTAATGVSIQLTINTGTGYFTGTTMISSGDTNIIVPVPEPGTLGLLGTGLVAIAGLVRRKLGAS